jgi:hypothetical protein
LRMGVLRMQGIEAEREQLLLGVHRPDFKSHARRSYWLEMSAASPEPPGWPSLP